MTNATNEIAVGTIVEVADGKYEGLSGTVIGVTKGWVEVEFDDEAEDGEATGKFRVKSLVVLEQDDTQENGEEYGHSDEDEDEDEDGEGLSNLARQIAKYREGYVSATNASGTKTKTCGDTLAERLLALTPAQVAMAADLFFCVGAGWHAARYSSLNAGQIRMNCGNKIRAAMRKVSQELQDATLQYAEGSPEREKAELAYRTLSTSLNNAILAASKAAV